MAELEDALAHARPSERHRLTLPAAAAATLAPNVGDEESAKAIAQYVVGVAAHPSASRKRSRLATATLARTLATDERRHSMRATSTELAATSSEEFPRAAAALTELLAEPVPNDPAKDELWVNLVIGLAEEQLAAALSADQRS